VRRGLIAAVAALVLVVAPGAAAGIDPLASAHAVVTVHTDGVLEMLEQLPVRAPSPSPTSWEVTMRQGELFAAPSLVVNDRRLSAGDGKRAGTFLVSRGTHGVRFDWTQPRGRGFVRFGYRLALLGTAYDDVVDLPIPIWEASWTVPVRELTAAGKLPRLAHGRILTWLEPDTLASTITTTRGDVRVRTRNVPAKTRVVLHVVFPRNVLESTQGVNVRKGRGLGTILAARNEDGRAPWWQWVVAAVAVALLSAAVLRTALSRLPRRR
jgi:hypothetical protein